MNSFAFPDAIRQDIRYALRTMLRKPAFAAMAVITLALAIGGNTAMFTIIHAVLLKPLQYGQPDRLVRISGGATPTRFAEMKAAAHSFAELAAFTGTENVALSTGAEPEVLQGVRVSASFLKIPDVQPMLGRSFRPGRRFAGRRTRRDDQLRTMAAALRRRFANRWQDGESGGDAVHHHRSSSATFPVSFPRCGRLDDGSIGLARHAGPG